MHRHSGVFMARLPKRSQRGTKIAVPLPPTGWAHCQQDGELRAKIFPRPDEPCIRQEIVLLARNRPPELTLRKRHA